MVNPPAPGTLVSPQKVRKIGPYFLGPAIGSSPVKSIVQVLARKKDDIKYYTLKILTHKKPDQENQDDRQGKILIHTERSLLDYLCKIDYVVHHHGYFQDQAFEQRLGPDRKHYYTGNIIRRSILVLDCLYDHDHLANTINLQQYVIRQKKLCQKEAAVIMYNIFSVVNELHKLNVVHRDLKLGNLILHTNQKVTITNFCLGKLLSGEKDLLTDQRGSPAYISPDVLCGRPYLGKPSDMWALGVVLYTMLYGQFPFYDTNPSQLFNKIKTAEFIMPSEDRICSGMKNLIHGLLLLDPNRRLKAQNALDLLGTILMFNINIVEEPLQIVPVYEKKELPKAEKDSEPSPFAEYLDKKTEEVNFRQTTDESRGNGTLDRRFGDQISVHRVGEDARRLTQQELDRFRLYLPPLMTTNDVGPVPINNTVSRSLPMGNRDRLN